MNENKQIESQDLVDRIITIGDDNVRVEETIKTTYTQNHRDFISDVRQLHDHRKKIEETLEDEFKTKQEERITLLNEELDKLEPYRIEAETKHEESETKRYITMMIDGLKTELNKSVVDINRDNLNHFSKIFKKYKYNVYEDKSMTDEEIEKLKELEKKGVKF